MQDQHVPAIGRYYWAAFLTASLFGVSVGDLVIGAMTANQLGNWYLPLLAVAFTAILYAEARDTSSSVRWYWLAVIVAPSAANHLSDLSFLYLGVRRIWVCAGLLIVLVVTHLAFQSDAMRLIALRLQQRPRPSVPLTDATYWIALIVASTAGDLASDFLTMGVHMPGDKACLVLVLPIAVAAAIRRWTDLNRTWTYWTVVVTLNALGTGLGDTLASDPEVGIGLVWSVTVSGTVLAILLLR